MSNRRARSRRTRALSTKGNKNQPNRHKIVTSGGESVIVGLFERSQATATATAVQSAEYTALEVGERDDGNRAAYSLLSGVGLSTPTSLSPEELLSCVKTKNAARSEAHVVVRT